MIELIIGMAIGVVVAMLAVMVLRATIQVQGSVTSSTMSSTRSQVVGDMIDSAVRQAASAHGVRVSTDGTRLDVKLASACESFAVSGSELYYKKRSTAIGSTIDSTWTRLLTWGQSSGPGALVVTQAPSPNTGINAPYFSPAGTGTQVSYSFHFSGKQTMASANRSVDLISTVAQRATAGTGAACGF